MSRRAYVVTKEHEELIKRLLLVGVQHKLIAKIVGIDYMTLRKYYKDLLASGLCQANANVASALYNNAMKGNVAAQIFWLKTRAGWRETDRPEVDQQRKTEFIFRETSPNERIKLPSEDGD